MKSMIGLMLAACLVLPLAACKKEEAVKVEKAPVAAPTTDDKAAWNAYLSDQVPRHLGDIPSSNLYVYRVPSVVNESDPGEFRS